MAMMNVGGGRVDDRTSIFCIRSITLQALEIFLWCLEGLHSTSVRSEACKYDNCAYLYFLIILPDPYFHSFLACILVPF